MSGAAHHGEPSGPRVRPGAWVPTLYFAEGMPFFAVSLIAGIFYKRMGLANDVIALYTSWLLLPWSLKPLWSPLLEMFKTRKFFVVLLEFAGGIALAAVALCLPLPGFFRYTLALFAVVAFCSSTHDIAADGLYIASLTSREQAAYAGWQGGFYNVARFFSQGGLIIAVGMLETRMDRAARVDGHLRSPWVSCWLPSPAITRACCRIPTRNAIPATFARWPRRLPTWSPAS